MSPSSCCFSFETSVTTSPLSTAPLNAVESLHLGSSRVDDTTYFGMRFSLSAHSPSRGSHSAAKNSSVRRPSSRASASSASLSSTLPHSSRSLPPNWPHQPPCLKPSSPTGSWTIPSSETFSLTMIFPISVLLLACVVSFHLGRHLSAGELGARRAPSPPPGRCLHREGRRKKPTL